MDMKTFQTLKKVLQARPAEIAEMCPEGWDIDVATKRMHKLDIDEFRETVGHYIRNATDASFRGYTLQPTTCTNKRCPMYNGNRWMLLFHMHGEGYKLQWYFTMDDTAIDTECGDHSWLESIL